MDELVLVRHGMTERGVAVSDHQRRFDPPLSDLGRLQAQQVKEYLEKRWNKEYQAVATSLYVRSRQTGELVNFAKKPMVRVQALNEYYVSPDGEQLETVSMVESRAMNLLYSQWAVSMDRLIVVAHSSLNQTILRVMLNLPFSKAVGEYNNYCEMKVLRYDPSLGDEKWRVVDEFIPTQE